MSRNHDDTFIESCANGEVLMEDIDDFIDKWHESSRNIDLHEFLGMSWDEYSVWVKEPDILPFIIEAHIEKRPLREILKEYKTLPIAACSNAPEKAQKLLESFKSRSKKE